MSDGLEHTPDAGRMRRMLGSVWIRVGVTLALLALVASKIDWSRVGERASHGNPAEFAAAVALVALALVVGACRWRWLLHAAEVPLPLRGLMRVYAVATFSNTFLPTAVGGDVTRALLVVRRGPLLTRVAVTILVDRIGGLLGLVALAGIAFAFEPSTVPADARVLLLWVAVGLVAGSVVVVAVALRGPARVKALVPARLAHVARESRAVLAEYARARAILPMLLVTSVAFQVLVALQLVMLARAIDVHLSFAMAAVALALVTVVTMLPISVGGFGVREGSYVVLLGGVSIAATDATLISVLSVVTLFVASLPGAYLLARRGLVPVLEPPIAQTAG